MLAVLQHGPRIYHGDMLCARATSIEALNCSHKYIGEFIAMLFLNCLLTLEISPFTSSSSAISESRCAKSPNVSVLCTSRAIFKDCEEFLCILTATHRDMIYYKIIHLVNYFMYLKSTSPTHMHISYELIRKLLPFYRHTCFSLVLNIILNEISKLGISFFLFFYTQRISPQVTLSKQRKHHKGE